MRPLLRASVLIVLLVFAIPPFVKATSGGSKGNAEIDRGDSRYSNDESDNREGNSNKDRDDDDRRYASNNSNNQNNNGHKNDNNHPGHNQGNGHDHHGNGNGNGHDHHDHDPPISPHKPPKQAQHFACNFGKSLGFACFCGRH